MAIQKKKLNYIKCPPNYDLFIRLFVFFIKPIDPNSNVKTSLFVKFTFHYFIWILLYKNVSNKHIIYHWKFFKRMEIGNANLVTKWFIDFWNIFYFFITFLPPICGLAESVNNVFFVCFATRRKNWKKTYWKLNSYCVLHHRLKSQSNATMW